MERKAAVEGKTISLPKNIYVGASVYTSRRRAKRYFGPPSVEALMVAAQHLCSTIEEEKKSVKSDARLYECKVDREGNEYRSFQVSSRKLRVFKTFYASKNNRKKRKQAKTDAEYLLEALDQACIGYKINELELEIKAIKRWARELYGNTARKSRTK